VTLHKTLIECGKEASDSDIGVRLNKPSPAQLSNARALAGPVQEEEETPDL